MDRIVKYRIELEVSLSKSKMHDVNPDISDSNEYIENEIQWLQQSFNNVRIRKIELR